jgi:hypothetical protein
VVKNGPLLISSAVAVFLLQSRGKVKKMNASKSSEVIFLKNVKSVLSDGIFEYQKFKFWYILKGPGMETFGTYISESFGIL